MASLFRWPSETRQSGAAGAGLGGSHYEEAGIRTIGEENGMVVQPVHELYLVVGLGAALRFADAGRPALFLVYLLARLVTSCQVTIRGHVLSHGHERC